MTFKEAIPKIKEYAGTITAVAGACGVMYGVVTYFHNREERINDAASKQEVMEIIAPLSHKIDSLNANSKFIIQHQEQLAAKIDAINRNTLILKDEFIRHIKKDTNIPEQQKIDDILRLLQNMTEDLKKN
jgi:hypothetical protein